MTCRKYRKTLYVQERQDRLEVVDDLKGLARIGERICVAAYEYKGLVIVDNKTTVEGLSEVPAKPAKRKAVKR